MKKTKITFAILILLMTGILYIKELGPIKPWRKFNQGHLTTFKTHKNTPLSFAQRELTSTDEQCASDFNDTLHLKNEIASMEEQYFSYVQKKVETSSSHVKKKTKFEKLGPIAQHFIERGGRWLSDELDYTECKDIPCLYEAIYKKEKDIDLSLLSYWIYLNSGYTVAASPRIPNLRHDWDLKDHTNFLFNKEELTALWRVFKMLPPQFKRMPTLESLHRGPRTLPPGGLYSPGNPDASDPKEREDYPTEQAAEAGFNSLNNVWYIYYLNTCLQTAREGSSLEINYYTDKGKYDFKNIKGYIHTCILHELAHHYDYSNSSFVNNGKKIRPSDEKDWLELGGWTALEALVDERNYTKQFVKKSEKITSDYVTKYSLTSPQEDFAESVSYFKMRPEYMKTKAPVKFKYIQNRIFENRSFDTEGLYNYYYSSISEKMKNALLPMATQCQASALSTDENTTDQCHQTFINGHYQGLVKKLKSQEYEACDFFSNKELATKLEVKIIKESIDQIQELERTNKDLQEFSLLSKKLHQKTIEVLNPRQVAIYCAQKISGNGPGQKDCYNQEIKEVIEDIAAEFNTTKANEIIDYEIDFFTKGDYEYSKQENEASHLATALIMGIDELTSIKLIELINQCRDSSLQQEGESSSEITPENALLRPYTGHEQYIRLGVIHCLNLNFNKAINEVILNQYPKLRTYELNYLNQKYLTESMILLHQLIINSYEIELTKLQSFKGEIKTSLEQLISDIPVEEYNNKTTCEAAISQRLKDISLPKEATFDFNSKVKFLKPIIAEICRKKISTDIKQKANSDELSGQNASDVFDAAQRTEELVQNFLKKKNTLSLDIMSQCLELFDGIEEKNETTICYENQLNKNFDDLISSEKDKLGVKYKSLKRKFLNNFNFKEAKAEAIKEMTLLRKTHKDIFETKSKDLVIGCIENKNTPVKSEENQRLNSLKSRIEKTYGRHHFLADCIVAKMQGGFPAEFPGETNLTRYSYSETILKTVSGAKTFYEQLTEGARLKRATDDLMAIMSIKLKVEGQCLNYPPDSPKRPKTKQKLRECLNLEWLKFKSLTLDELPQTWWAKWYKRPILQQELEKKRYLVIGQMADTYWK